MDLYVRVSNNRGEARERERDGHEQGSTDPKCILSLVFSYVIHMIHVEPRGAGIKLTF